jgi:hypothetical protein
VISLGLGSASPLSELLERWIGLGQCVSCRLRRLAVASAALRASVFGGLGLLRLGFLGLATAARARISLRVRGACAVGGVVVVGRVLRELQAGDAAGSAIGACSRSVGGLRMPGGLVLAGSEELWRMRLGLRGRVAPRVSLNSPIFPSRRLSFGCGRV